MVKVIHETEYEIFRVSSAIMEGKPFEDDVQKFSHEKPTRCWLNKRKGDGVHTFSCLKANANVVRRF